MKTHKFVNKVVKMYIVQTLKKIKRDMNSNDVKICTSQICDFLKENEMMAEYNFGNVSRVDDTRLVEFALYYKLHKTDKVYILGLSAIE